MANDVPVDVVVATDSSPSRRVWRRVAIGVVLVFAAAFVVQHRQDVPDAWRVVRHSSPAWLGLAAVLTVAWLLNLGLLHAATQRSAGLGTRAVEMAMPAVAANFLNMITKSGGMAGLAIMLRDSRRRGIGRGPIVAAYLLAAALVEMAFGATLVVAMVMVALRGRLTVAEVSAGAVFALYLAARITIIVVAWRSRESIRRLFHLPSRFANWLRRRPHSRPHPEHRAADEFHEAMILIRRAPLRSLPAVVNAIVYAVLGVFVLWAVIASVGAGKSLVVALVGYAVTVLFTIVGFLPSGVGFVEVSLGAVLISFGSEGPRAAAAVVVYRIFQLWLPVIVGALFSARLRRAAGGPASRNTVAAPAP